MSGILNRVDPDTEHGRETMTKLGEQFVAAERRRLAATEGLRAEFEGESSPTEKAIAALAFCNACAGAEHRYMHDMQRAALNFISGVTGQSVDEIEQGMKREKLRNDPEAMVGKLMESPEFRAFVDEQCEGDVAMLAMEVRGDGVVRIACATDLESLASGEEVDALYFSPLGEYLGTVDPGRFDRIEPLGEATIDGIDLSQTVEPERDFDGGYG